MAKRVKVHIDRLSHINDLKFEIYRSTESNVDNEDLHVMTVDDLTSIHQIYTQMSETLQRDSQIPNVFHVKRFFHITPFPTIQLGTETILPSEVGIYPEEKMIEILGKGIGFDDRRVAFMDYEYEGIPVLDDFEVQSGVTYHGTPAVSIKPILDLHIYYDYMSHRIVIEFEADLIPITYYYRIYAKDTAGNVSPWSDTQAITLDPREEDIYFRIQRANQCDSPEDEWQTISFSGLMKWLDVPYAIDNPDNVHNLNVFALNSKEAEIEFDNPWFYWLTYTREAPCYRVRAEDDKGAVTDWVYIEEDDFNVFVKPKRIIIRRKVDNGIPCSETGDDGFTLFVLEEADIDPTNPVIRLLDNQLNDATKYGYTIFYEDESGKKAIPLYEVSDHTIWKNLLLFPNEIRTDLASTDFLTEFDLHDTVIDIGTGV